MIQKLEINAVHADVNDDLRKYVEKKIGKMDLYMSRHVRDSAHVEVKLKESSAKGKKQATCEVILYLPHEALTVKETTINMYAAVDIVEAKLKNLLKKYKEKHDSPKLRRRIISRLRRKS
jgi:putative sigma-54 modulation protein